MKLYKYNISIQNMKFFRNLFSPSSISKNKIFTNYTSNSDDTTLTQTNLLNINKISEQSLLPQSFQKLINNLETKNLLKKVENNFHDFSSNKSLLRTIVDENPLQEDIFKHLVRKAKTKIPDKIENKKNKISLFLPVDDILVYTYIPDENFGMSDIPKHKDYDFRLELPEYKTFAYVFLRDNFAEFMDFISENFEPILYSTAERNYIDKLLNVIDSSNVFSIKLYQQDCHLYKDTTQNYLEYIKDINLFTNRNLKQKVLLDSSAFNYLLSPDNGN